MIAAVIYLTASRGGAIAAAVSMLMLLVLAPGRMKILIGLIFPVVGTLLLVTMLNDRPELRDGNAGPLAASQGSDMIGITLAVILTVAAMQALIAWLMERDGGLLPDVSRGTTQVVGMIAGVIAVFVVVALIGSGFVGSAAAYAMVMSDVGREIVMVDLNHKRAVAEASDILHALSKYKNFGVMTFQAEDEIAAMTAAIGAAFGGVLAVAFAAGRAVNSKIAAISRIATMAAMPQTTTRFPDRKASLAPLGSTGTFPPVFRRSYC